MKRKNVRSFISLLLAIAILTVFSGCASTPKSTKSGPASTFQEKDNRQQPSETVGVKVTQKLLRGHKTRKHDGVTAFTAVFPDAFASEMRIHVKNDDLEMYSTPRFVWHGWALVPRAGTNDYEKVFLQAYLMDQMTPSCKAQLFVIVDDIWSRLHGMHPIIYSTGGKFAADVRGKKVSPNGRSIAAIIRQTAEIRDSAPNTKAEKRYLARLTDPRHTMLREGKGGYTLYPKGIPFHDISGRNPEYTHMDRLGQNGSVTVGATSFEPAGFITTNVINNTIAANSKPTRYFYQDTPAHYKQWQNTCLAKGSRIAKRGN